MTTITNQTSSARNAWYALAGVFVAVAGQGALAASISPQAEVPTPNTSKAEFASEFLMNGVGPSVDLSHFEEGNIVAPGTYEVVLFVNQQQIGRKSIDFAASAQKQDAQPVFTQQLLERMGVALDKLPASLAQTLASGQALGIDDIIPGATATFDFNEQQLQISLPQIALSRSARGQVNADTWDTGVTAAILGYNANIYRLDDGRMPARTMTYVGTQAGINVDGWRLRHQGSYQNDSSQGHRYQALSTYAQHDLTEWRSQLTVGDAFTSGELFESSGFRGVRIQTDDRMLPESLRGYAPVVRGVASTNARVVIRQNGNVIYETVVAPGAFLIDDLYATGYGGDLEVSVLEADGRTKSFPVPYASVPLSLRTGVNRFSLLSGQLRDTRLKKSPLFAQGSWQRGLSNMVTGFGGLTAAPDYVSVLLGGVLTATPGAFGLDMTHAKAQDRSGRTHAGTSLRASYSKLFNSTGTNLTLAAYRYSTSGYYNLNDAMYLREQPQIATLSRTRHRGQLALNQSLGERAGQLYANATVSNYWGDLSSDVNYAVGYSNTIGKVSFGVSATRQRSGTGTRDTLLHVSVTIPFGGDTNPTLSSSLSRDSEGRSTLNSTWSASAGEDHALTYSVTANRSQGGAQDASTAGGANLAYRSSVATFSSSASTGNGYSQFAIGAQGAVVAHSGGVTLSQPVSETIAIIEAKDAAGARVINASGVRVDRRGYAVIPYVTPYSINTIELDPKGLSTDVELQSTSQQVVPRAGAVAVIKFATKSGRTAVIHARRADGQPLPFGAVVYDKDGAEMGVVGQGSRLVARGLLDKGELHVRWGTGTLDACLIDYALAPLAQRSTTDSFEKIEAICRALSLEAGIHTNTGALAHQTDKRDMP